MHPINEAKLIAGTPVGKPDDQNSQPRVNDEVNNSKNKIYPGVPICQIFYHQIVGSITEYASDKYQHNRDIQPSLFYSMRPSRTRASSLKG